MTAGITGIPLSILRTKLKFLLRNQLKILAITATIRHRIFAMEKHKNFWIINYINTTTKTWKGAY
ncbi:MAG: hypothetical protein WAZ77_01870, partial [Candidatus Nitrosopolaris sp.]